MTQFSCPDIALVLTAGLGTRFRPLSYVRAKPAAPLAGKTVIRRILGRLKQGGVAHVVLNLHHRPESIAVEVGDGSDLGLTVRYCWEQPILGSGGGPRHALPLLERDTFFIVNGDTITNVDLQALAAAHTQSGALVTLALMRQRDCRRYGGVALDERGVVTEFVAKGSARRAAHFVGVQIAQCAAFSDLPDNVPAESFRDVCRKLLATRPDAVRGVVYDADFYDVGTPGDYLAASLAIARREGLRELPLGRRSFVDRSSRLVDCVVWDDVFVERDCELVRCIVGDGVIVPAGSGLANAAIVRAAGRAPAAGERLMGDLLIADIPAGHVR
jgi:NDP-sugar pyrophosphorylase family protein